MNQKTPNQNLINQHPISQNPINQQIGVVAIGRNEGQRLRQCLESVLTRPDLSPETSAVHTVVYVDSGSTDESVAIAQSLGVTVVDLDLSIPFTAARARNEGFAELIKKNPELTFVQFVDGDCEVQPEWLDQAHTTLLGHSDVAVVCGRRRERFPDHSLYNRLCDLEWNTPVGETKACGGDALMRVEAFQRVGGFKPDLIAGEEPELCVRLRQSGWKILRLDREMTLHDAQMTRFQQWWRRSLRAGYAYAAGAWLHGRSPERHWVKESVSCWIWGLLWPLFLLGLVWPTHGMSLFGLFSYPLMVFRIYQGFRKQDWEKDDAALYGFFCMLAKFPQVQGQFQFFGTQLIGQQHQLVEYKSLPNPNSTHNSLSEGNL